MLRFYFRCVKSVVQSSYTSTLSIVQKILYFPIKISTLLNVRTSVFNIPFFLEFATNEDLERRVEKTLKKKHIRTSRGRLTANGVLDGERKNRN